MKIFTALKYLAGILVCPCGAAAFYHWGYDAPSGVFGFTDLVQVFSSPKSSTQLAIITIPALQGSPEYYLGVRASESEKWKQFINLNGATYQQPEPIWSIDGSVIAMTGEQEPFRAAYDFRLQKSYGDPAEQTKLTSNQIFGLLQKRGGGQHDKNPFTSREFAPWRWQDADLKALLRNWKE